MNSRQTRPPIRSPQSALIHIGPQAKSASANISPPIHAPNAALLIDFDNVTMGIRSELGKELHSLLSSDIIKGKVSVRRAYADWRRYPQYIVPLSEASIDLIFAPAYGASKKNATDIRLAIDALELVFTRPEIGTFVLLSGDSDFSSMVIKLKEYGKYVIGIGIKESSSDLLVQNCDEYYSYNALAGLVKASDEEDEARRYDPWELVTEAVQRMKRNDDVMRSDRLKQVMQEIDSTFDEKNLGISKFSRFCQEAAQRGLLSVTKLDNGQLEVDLPGTVASTTAEAARPESVAVGENGDTAVAAAEDRGPRRGRRGRGGRGRDREDRPPRPPRETPPVEVEIQREPEPLTIAQQTAAEIPPPPPEPIVDFRPASADAVIGSSGERLTRSEAFDLVRRTVNELASGDESVRASDVRKRARELLGRDSESLSDRMFVRILKDAHDSGIVDLRRRGDDFEVGRAAEAPPVSEQVARNEQAAAAAAAPSTPPAATPRLGMGHRGALRRGRPGAPPPDLLSIGVVDHAPTIAPEPISPPTAPAAVAAEPPEERDNGGPPARRPRRGRGKTAKAAAPVSNKQQTELLDAEPPAKAKPARAAKKASKPKAKKSASAKEK